MNRPPRRQGRGRGQSVETATPYLLPLIFPDRLATDADGGFCGAFGLNPEYVDCWSVAVDSGLVRGFTALETAGSFSSS